MVCYMVCYMSLRTSVCSVHENSHAPFSESGSRPRSLFNRYMISRYSTGMKIEIKLEFE